MFQNIFYNDFPRAMCVEIMSCLQGRTQGEGFGVNPPPLNLIFYENFITSAKEINCFCIPFAC